MRKRILYIISLLVPVLSMAQLNQVHAGGELINFGVLNISSTSGHKWTSERSASPGYFGVFDKATLIGFSDQTHIDGYIKKYGNTAFVFPVGSGNDLRTLEISKPDLLSDTYATAWIVGDPGGNLDPTGPHAGQHPVTSVADPIVSVSSIGQWDWQTGAGGNLGTQTTGNGTGIKITASIPDLSRFADKTELRLVGWNGTNWIDLSGRPSATGNREDSKLSGTLVAGISAIAIGKVRTNVAANFVSITAKTTDCKTTLNWETDYELDSSVFILEQSRDGIRFQPIASVAANGTSIGNNYAAAVIQPFSSAYYRIRTNNSNGISSISTAIYHVNNCQEITKMLVYPNPVADNQALNIRFTTAYSGEATLNIYNYVGQKIRSKMLSCNPGSQQISLSVQEMIPGSYFIELVAANGMILTGSNQFSKQ